MTIVQRAENIRTGCIDQHDAWQELILTVMKKLEYPLGGVDTNREIMQLYNVTSVFSKFAKSLNIHA